jgi:hypothetical protein
LGNRGIFGRSAFHRIFTAQPPREWALAVSPPFNT